MRHEDTILFRDIVKSKALLRALEDRDFQHPTPIQHKSYSKIMSGKDTVGIAQTGTGKTLAYLLPLMTMWKFRKDRHPQILVIVPTRELVQQVVEEAQQLASYMNLHVVGVFGGVNIKRHIQAVEDGLDLLVGTPGRIADLKVKGVLNTRFIKKLVIDEVDEMLNLGFRHQLLNIFDMLPAKRQNLMFSATLTDDVKSIIDDFFWGPQIIEAAPEGTPLEQVTQEYIKLPNFLTKVDWLVREITDTEKYSRCIVFVSTKRLADLLAQHITPDYEGTVGVIHSNKSQNHRFNTVESFANGELNILIATDIIARGIDISGVSHVINFDVPDSVSQYIHRIGRTGRAEATGAAITLVSAVDQQPQYWESILDNAKIQCAELEVPEDLPIQTELMEHEKPHVYMRNKLTKAPKINPGQAFHKKKDPRH